MRNLRGLYVIRSGGAPPVLATRAARSVRADGAGDAAAPDDGRLATLLVDFSRFDTWYEIDSFWEGRFLERTVKGAFKRTIAAHWRAAKGQGGSTVKVLFNHGFEFNEGDKPLGAPEVLEERAESPHMEVPLLDTSYNRDLLPGLREGVYGSSFMFRVLAEKWVKEPDRSDDNPDGLPERTITEVRLFEAGPVTWPANPDATAGVRSASGTDWLVDSLTRRDAARRDQLVADLAAFRAKHGLRTPPEGGSATPADDPTPAPGDEPARHVEGNPTPAAQRTARLRALQLAALRRRTT